MSACICVCTCGAGSRRRVRRQYTVAEKIEIVNYAAQHSVMAAARKFHVGARSIFDWKRSALAIERTEEPLQAHFSHNCDTHECKG